MSLGPSYKRSYKMYINETAKCRLFIYSLRRTFCHMLVKGPEWLLGIMIYNIWKDRWPGRTQIYFRHLSTRVCLFGIFIDSMLKHLIFLWKLCVCLSIHAYMVATPLSAYDMPTGDVYFRGRTGSDHRNRPFEWQKMAESCAQTCIALCTSRSHITDLYFWPFDQNL